MNSDLFQAGALKNTPWVTAKKTDLTVSTRHKEVATCSAQEPASSVQHIVHGWWENEQGEGGERRGLLRKRGASKRLPQSAKVPHLRWPLARFSHRPRAHYIGRVDALSQLPHCGRHPCHRLLWCGYPQLPPTGWSPAFHPHLRRRGQPPLSRPWGSRGLQVGGRDGRNGDADREGDGGRGDFQMQLTKRRCFDSLTNCHHKSGRKWRCHQKWWVTRLLSNPLRVWYSRNSPAFTFLID